MRFDIRLSEDDRRLIEAWTAVHEPRLSDRAAAYGPGGAPILQQFRRRVTKGGKLSQRVPGATDRTVKRWLAYLVNEALRQAAAELRMPEPPGVTANPRTVVLDVPLGELVAVTYRYLDGKTYRHRFDSNARPKVGADSRGKLVVAGGGYQVDPRRGIVG